MSVFDNIKLDLLYAPCGGGGGDGGDSGGGGSDGPDADTTAAVDADLSAAFGDVDAASTAMDVDSDLSSAFGEIDALSATPQLEPTSAFSRQRAMKSRFSPRSEDNAMFGLSYNLDAPPTTAFGQSYDVDDPGAFNRGIATYSNLATFAPAVAGLAFGPMAAGVTDLALSAYGQDAPGVASSLTSLATMGMPAKSAIGAMAKAAAPSLAGYAVESAMEAAPDYSAQGPTGPSGPSDARSGDGSKRGRGQSVTAIDDSSSGNEPPKKGETSYRKKETASVFPQEWEDLWEGQSMFEKSLDSKYFKS